MWSRSMRCLSASACCRHSRSLCRPVAQPPLAASMWIPKGAPPCRASGPPAIAPCTMRTLPDGGYRLRAGRMPRSKAPPAGRSMAGNKAPAAQKRPWFWTDQFGCNIQMLGVTGPQDGVAFAGPAEAAPGAIYRTFDRTTGLLTSVVAFSDPQAIRAARAELDAATLFDPAVHGPLLSDERDSADTTTEASLMNANPSLSLTKRYIWPADGLTRIPDWVYTDRAIYEREVEKIFHGRTWNYVRTAKPRCPMPAIISARMSGRRRLSSPRAEDGVNQCFREPLRPSRRRVLSRAVRQCQGIRLSLSSVVLRSEGQPRRRSVPAGRERHKAACRPTSRIRIMACTGSTSPPIAAWCSPPIAMTWSRSRTISRRRSCAEFEATFDGRTPDACSAIIVTSPAGQLEALSREPQRPVSRDPAAHLPR